jgi:hypothetical protein
MSIMKWFAKNSSPNTDINKNILPKYFYLNYKLKSIEWLYDITNKDIKEIGKINWKHVGVIIVCCDKDMYETNNNDDKYNIYNTYNLSHLPILRSNLQKCVRREHGLLGMQTCVTIINIDNGLFELLRRITIIIIEDSILCFDYGVLVWFLCAVSKGFVVNNNLTNWILQIIATNVMWSNHKDMEYDNINNTNYNTNYNINIILESNISAKYKNLLISLQLRTSFGGMQSDVNMLHKSSLIWLKRIEDVSYMINFLDANIYNYIYVNYDIINNIILDPEDILLESFDFHCTNICDRIIKKIGLDINIQKLKKLIWDNSSSVNNRLDINYKQYKKANHDDDWLFVEPIYKICCMEIKLELQAKLEKT